jgi:monofunctional biosynthetic peptidoglycan transglycosylase
VDNNQSAAKEPRSRKQKILSIIWKAALVCLLLPVVQVVVLKWIDPPFSTMMLWKSAGNLFSGERVSFSHTNVNRDEVARSFYQAVVAAEDQRFFEHSGFDLKEIENARRQHELHPNRPMRGASTISQQVAKNLFLPPIHSFVRKGVEAYYTILIEFFWSKERILEMYGNIVELAPSVYGVEEGARYHFHKRAAGLSASEAAQLAAVLPNPSRWSASKPSAYIRRRESRIIRQMRGLPTTDDDDGEPD